MFSAGPVTCASWATGRPSDPNREGSQCFSLIDWKERFGRSPPPGITCNRKGCPAQRHVHDVLVRDLLFRAKHLVFAATVRAGTMTLAAATLIKLAEEVMCCTSTGTSGSYACAGLGTTCRG
jgi:hypothetical protein